MAIFLLLFNRRSDPRMKSLYSSRLCPSTRTQTFNYCGAVRFPFLLILPCKHELPAVVLLILTPLFLTVAKSSSYDPIQSMPAFFTKKASVAPCVTSPGNLPGTTSSEKKSMGRKLMRFIKKVGGRKRAHPSNAAIATVAASQTTPADESTNAVAPPSSLSSGGNTEETEPARGPVAVVQPGQTSTNEEPKKGWRKVKKTLRNLFAVVFLGVEGVAAASDAFPPAKSAAAGLVFIKDAYQKVQDDKDDGERVLHQMERSGESLEKSLERATPNGGHFSKPMEEAIINLNRVLVQGADDVSQGSQLGLFGRLTRLRKRLGQRRRIRENIQHTIEDFTVGGFFRAYGSSSTRSRKGTKIETQ